VKTATPEELERAAERFEVAAERDPTNPYFIFYRAYMLELTGRSEEASVAYRAAAELPGAPWCDFPRLAEWLDSKGRRDDAATAFERGYAGMLAAGVRPERLQFLATTYNFLVGRDGAKNLRAALAAGDVEHADAVMMRRWRMMPRLEGGALYWRVFGGWLRDNGRPELAATWEERAKDAESGWAWLSDRRGDRAHRLWIPLVLGMLMAVPLAALLLGFRLGANKQRLRGLLAGLVLVGAPLFGAAGLAGLAAEGLDWTIPFVDESFDAPSVTTYLERQPPSAARDTVLAYARAEADATRRGTRFDGPMPDDATISEALAPSYGWSEWIDGANDLFSSTRRIALVFSQMTREEGPASVSIFWDWDTLLDYVVVLLLPLLLGLGIGRFAPKVATALSWAIPGGHPSFSVASGLIIGVFCAALLVVCGYFDGFLSTAIWARYLGMQDVWREPDLGLSQAWWYYPLFAAVVAQLAAVLITRRLARRKLAANG
jgi:hypothetical protein